MKLKNQASHRNDASNKHFKNISGNYSKYEFYPHLDSELGYTKIR